MSTPTEKLEADKKVNDTKIKELKGKILKYDDIIEKGGQLSPDQKEQLDAWRARLSELTQSNDKLNHEMTAIVTTETNARRPSE